MRFSFILFPHESIEITYTAHLVIGKFKVSVARRLIIAYKISYGKNLEHLSQIL